MCKFVQTIYMKKILHIAALLFLFQFSFSQRLVKDECFGNGGDQLISHAHENADSTTTLIVETNQYDSLSAQHSSYSVMKLDRNKEIISKRNLDALTDKFLGQIYFDNDGSFLSYYGKFDNSGNFLWEPPAMNLFDPYLNPWMDIKRDVTGGYLISDNFEGNTIKKFISISNNGTLRWSHIFYADSFPFIHYTTSRLSILGLDNKNVFVCLSSHPLTNSGIFDTSIVRFYLFDSTGILIAQDSIHDPALTVTSEFANYTSAHLINCILTANYFTDTARAERLFFSPDDLSVVRHDTISINDISFTSLDGKFEDTSHVIMISVRAADSIYSCKDISLHTLWTYKTRYSDYNMLPIDNNTVFMDKRLIRNGSIIWESDVETPLVITEGGYAWNNLSPFTASAKLDYNKKDICYTQYYQNGYIPFLDPGQVRAVIQIIDIQTGHVKEKMVIDPKSRTIEYLNHYKQGAAIAAAGDAFTCTFGTKDLYVAWFSNTYNSILGAAYIDYNNNHLPDAGETGYPYGYAFIKSAADSQQEHLFNTGWFYFFTDSGTYTTHLSLYNDYFTITPQQYTTTHHTYGNADTLLFALHPKPGKNDLEIKLINNQSTRLGTENTYILSLTNKGASMGSGKVKYLLDPKLPAPVVTPMYQYMSGDTMIWNISGLPAGVTLSSAIRFTATGVSMGDTLSSYAWIVNDSADIFPSDNYAALEETVRSSFDPNDKNILSGSNLTTQQVANGDYISYVIHFQNKGNDTAFKVIVLDTLSSNVDINSLQVIGSSAPYTLQILQDHILKFIFDDIHLSSDTTNISSTGYIAYKLKAKSNLSAGSTINNTADILFDYNTPVKTNTVQTRIILLTSFTQIKSTKENLSIYPNPNNGLFTVKFEDKHAGNIQLQLIDLTGKIILMESKQHRDISEFTIDASTLSKGMYWLKVFDGNNSVIKAIVVQ